MSATQPQPLLSVAIVAGGDLAALQETLTTAEAVADEIVLVAAQGGDDLAQIAAARQVVVVQHDGDDDFSALRNHALQHVRGAWVLWLAPGEQMSAADARELRRFLQQQADPQAAYKLCVCIPPPAGAMAGEQAEQTRLAPNVPAVRFAGRVRESLAPSLAQAGLQTESLPLRIERSSREHEAQRKTQRAQLELRLAEQAMTEQAITEQGPSPQMLNCAAEACQVLGDAQRSEQLHRQALASSARGSQEMLEAYYGLLTALDGGENASETQLSLCIEALAVFPSDMQLLCAMGGYLQAQGRTHLAAQTFHTAYEQGKVETNVWHLQEVRQVAGVCYARLLETQNQRDQALQFLEAAVQTHPQSVVLRKHLLEMQLRCGRPEAALALLDQLPAANAENAALRNAVIGACLASKECWASAISYLKRAFTENCRDPMCLKWLAVALMATSKFDEAQRLLEDWLLDDPDCSEAKTLLHAARSRATTRSPDGQLRRLDQQHGSGGLAAPATSPAPFSTAARSTGSR